MSPSSSRNALDLRRYAPPGVDFWSLVVVVLITLLVCAMISLGVFSIRLHESLKELYVGGITHPDYLREGAVMAEFGQVLRGSLLPFLSSSPLLLSIFLAYYLSYYHQESKSIYLMRRLPDRWELPRRTLPLPLAAALLLLLAAFLFLLLHFLTYQLRTPEQCLPPDQWRRFWRSLL